MFCQNCGKEIDNKAKICIHCGASIKKKNGCFSSGCLVCLIVIVLFMALSYCIGLMFYGEIINEISNNFNESIDKTMIDNAIKEYNVAVSGGDKTIICIEAGSVAQAYLMAKDEENYKKWLAIEKKKCRSVWGY